MKLSPILSIILPVFNGEEFIRTAIDSVIGSSLNSWELILINDGSTDSTEEICRDYSQRDKRIHYISQENRGLSAARNSGFFYARGKYIAYLDADDYVSKDYYEALISEAEHSFADILITGFIREFQYTNYSHKVTVCFPKLLFFANTLKKVGGKKWGYNLYIHVWNKLYRRDFLLKHEICFDEALRYGEDVPYNIQILTHTSKILFLDLTGYHYVCRNSPRLTTRWDEQLVAHNGRILRQIVSYERSNWQTEKFPIAAGMYLRSCFLALERAKFSNLPLKNRCNLIKIIIHLPETQFSIKQCRFGHCPAEFWLYSQLLKTNNPLIIHFAFMLRLYAKKLYRRQL